jgi:DNA polymerase I
VSNGGLKELYEQLDIVPTCRSVVPRPWPAKLEEHREMAFLSYELATIKIDVPLDVGLDDLHLIEPDREKLLELYTLLEFKSWIRRDSARCQARRVKRLRGCGRGRRGSRLRLVAPVPVEPVYDHHS